MNYVAMLKLHASMIEADRKRAMERRAASRRPEGVLVLAEDRPIGGTFDVVSIISASLIIPVMELVVEWSQQFEVTIRPAIPASDVPALRLWELSERSRIRVEDLTNTDRDEFIWAMPGTRINR